MYQATGPAPYPPEALRAGDGGVRWGGMLGINRVEPRNNQLPVLIPGCGGLALHPVPRLVRGCFSQRNLSRTRLCPVLVVA